MTRHAPREPVAVATLAVAALWALAALLTWTALQHGVRIGSPNAIYHDGQIALFGQRVHLAPMAATLALNLLAGVIGLRFVILPIWGQRFTSPVWSLLAAVVPGYLLIVPVTRLVTLVLPHTLAPAIVWALVLAAGAFAAHSLWRRRPHLGAMQWRDAIPAVVAVIAILVFQLHFDRFHISGEASLWYYISVYFHEAHGLGTDARLPLIAQHYDEPAFLYPIVFGLMSPSAGAGSTIAAMHWLTLGFGKIGVLSLTYLALRGLDLDRMSALVCVLFVSAASLSLNPASSHLLFDSLSPLGYGLHTARLLLPVMPLLILSALVNAGERASLRATPIAVLLGLGMAALPLHGALMFPFAFVLMLGTAISPRAGASNRMWRLACAGALTVLIGASIAYGLPSAPASVLAVTLIVSALLPAAAMAIGALVWLKPTAPSRSALTGLALICAAGLGYAVGMTLLGNLAIERIAPALDGVWPWRGLTVEDRFSSHYVAPAFELSHSTFCQSGFDWGFRTLGAHCASLPLFIRSYGLAFVAIAAVLAWAVLLQRPRAPRPSDTPILWTLALCLFALPLAFALFDFVSSRDADGFTYWVRSRLLEPFFISGILAALALFHREASLTSRRWAQNLMLFAVAFLAFNPFVFAGQWIANVAYLIAALTGR